MLSLSFFFFFSLSSLGHLVTVPAMVAGPVVLRSSFSWLILACYRSFRSLIEHQSWPLTLDRAYYESEALLAAQKHCPQHSPEVYHADRTMATIVMRYIGTITFAQVAMVSFMLARLQEGFIEHVVQVEIPANMTLLTSADDWLNFRPQLLQTKRTCILFLFCWTIECSIRGSHHTVFSRSEEIC